MKKFRDYLFSHTCSEWQVWAFMLSAFALGKGSVFWWAFILIVSAVVEGAAQSKWGYGK